MENKWTWYELPGNYTTERAKKIKQIAQGQTFMNLEVQYGGMAHNNKITFGTQHELEDPKELEEMVIFLLVSDL